MLKKVILFFILSIALVIAAAFYNMQQVINKLLPVTEPQLLVIEKGSSVTSFANQLVSLGWLKHNIYLKSYVKLFPRFENIKTGTYQVTADMNLSDLLALLVSGKEHQFTITFIEGSTFKEILTQLQLDPHLQQTLISLPVNQISKKIGIKHDNPEGWIFPDTYAFTSGTSDIAILKRAHQKMILELNLLWSQRISQLPYQSAYEVLIMASIIEKETSFIPEQPIISGVFLNRLRKKMRLQTDPTVIYGLGDRYQGDITRAHLREKTAYNTYRINGLPPTPIAMPGLSAIQSVVNPADTGYFYFVSQGNGQHTFSRTLSEHNNAVRLYLKQQKQRND